MDEARTLQARLGAGEHGGHLGLRCAGLKAALEFVAHYGGEPRRPLAPLGQGERVKLRSLLAEADLLRGMRPATLPVPRKHAALLSAPAYPVSGH